MLSCMQHPLRQTAKGVLLLLFFGSMLFDEVSDIILALSAFGSAAGAFLHILKLDRALFHGIKHIALGYFFAFAEYFFRIHTFLVFLFFYRSGGSVSLDTSPFTKQGSRSKSCHPFCFCQNFLSIG